MKHMQNHKYLIIGGGMAADSAAKGIREIDQNGTIGMISNENVRPYNRPPLSKALWKGDPEDNIWRKTEDVDLHLSRTAKSLDPKNKTVTDDHGETYAFDKLLIATGGKVNRLPYNISEIIYYRTFGDYKKLREQTSAKKNFVVIGGGFIGSEIAAALAINARNVTMIFPEDGIGAKVFPSRLSKFLSEYYEEKGVRVMAGESLTSIEKNNSTFAAKTKSGKTITADCVIAGIGIKPDTDLAQSAGLQVDNGIVVDENLQSSQPDTYAAGDVANFYNPALDKRMRVEHEDNSNTMGEIAGKNMAGAKLPYHHLPFFYSDLFDLGYEAVGELDARHEIIEQWKEPFREGVVYYLQNKRVRGVLLWNTWGQLDHARALIAEKGPLDPVNILNRLPN